ncbi:MAG: threonine/serine exporter family protein, partial [Candidatus Saccharimonadales bacterium]
MKWWPRLIAKPDTDEMMSAGFASFDKIDETLTPNLRALRLAMTACDILLTMGVSANSVVSKALDITETYCKRAVHIDINANLIMVSQLRGIENEPLTLIRPVTPRETNNMTIQSVQRLIYLIRNGKYTLEQAEAALELILKKPRSYPWWVVTMGSGGIVAGVALMFTSSWQMVLTTFFIGMFVDRLLAFMAKRAIPTFFRHVGAALFVTLVSAIVALLDRSGVEFFSDMNPTLIVVGGVILLLSGLV